MVTGDVIVSAPALAVALRRRSLSLNPAPLLPALEARSLPPMYRIDRKNMEAESAGAARVVVEVGERMRRLADAYGAWTVFEPEPYFDLQPAQTSLLVHVSERVSTVHVTFFVDALMPSFQDAVAYLVDGAASVRSTVALWDHVVLTLTRTRERLASDIGYWALNCANEERNRWRSTWNHLPAALDTGSDLSLDGSPTLTLCTEFPLPAARQPGRRRRLRRMWEREKRRRA